MPPGLLRSARLQAGLTLRQLAAAAHTSHSTLAAYETGAKCPTVETLNRIVEAAGFRLEGQPVRSGRTLRPRRPRSRARRRARVGRGTLGRGSMTARPRVASRQDRRAASCARKGEGRPCVRRRTRAGMVHSTAAGHERHRHQHLRATGADRSRAAGTPPRGALARRRPGSPAARRAGAVVVGHHARRLVPEHDELPPAGQSPSAP